MDSRNKKLPAIPHLYCTCISLVATVLVFAANSATHASWLQDPEITLAAAENDPRIPAVFEAVHFWNASLQELHIPLQFGQIHLIPPPDIEESLKIMSERDLAGNRLPYPSFLDDIDTGILIVLTNAEIVSFAEHWEKERKALIAVKSARTPPLSLPNVTRNVIAHELGHVLGLDHNGEETLLMCGRPSPCRPDRYASATPRFLRLTDSEKALLRSLYDNDLRRALPGLHGDE